MAIQIRQVLTADNTDVLNGTDLENIPGPGLLLIGAASTQNDTIMNITGRGFEVPFREQALALRTNGQLTEDDDAITVFTPQGGKVIVDINVQTAATVVVEAMFIPDQG